MNTQQLMCSIRCDDDMNREILGVYASDKIPKNYNSLPYGFIANTDPHHLPGKHWVAFYVNEQGVLETFDSYGKAPGEYSPFFTRFMNTFERKLINRKQLQNYNTKVCGQYCLFFLMCRCRRYSMRDIMNIFSYNFEINDQFVNSFINERFYCCINPTTGFCQTCIKHMC